MVAFTEMDSSPLLRSVAQKADAIDRLTADVSIPLLQGVLALLRANGIVAPAQDEADSDERLAREVFTLVKEVPSLARGAVMLVSNESVPVVRRVGVAAFLTYIAIEHDLIPDDWPGGYGYLDDWFVFQIGFAELAGGSTDLGVQLARHGSKAWPALVSLIEHLDGFKVMARELRTQLPLQSETSLRTKLERLLATVPSEFRPLDLLASEPSLAHLPVASSPQLPPPVPVVWPSGRVGAGWVAPNSGAMRLSFPDGSGVARSPSGQIVAWRRRR